MSDEWLRMDHWWKDTDRGKPKNWEKNILLCLKVMVMTVMMR
jgi:hypothetical protein